MLGAVNEGMIESMCRVKVRLAAILAGLIEREHVVVSFIPLRWHVTCVIYMLMSQRTFDAA